MHCRKNRIKFRLGFRLPIMKKFLFLFVLVLCCSRNVSDREQITELYATLIESFASGDLRGVMKPISEEFHSTEAYETNYQQLQKFYENYIRNNSNIVFQINNLRIEIVNDYAEVTYDATLRSRENLIEFERKDILEKSGGKWKIIEWRYL